MIRRSREKVRGRVRPSPVGEAIENDENPSPPSPSPAKLGPLATKMLQFIARAMRVIVSTLVEWIDAVWRNPCSARTARSIAWSTVPTRTTGSTGIICSVHTRLWSRGTSAISSRGSGSALTPISARIFAASRPIQAGLITPGLPGSPSSRKITRSRRRSSCSLSR